MIFYFKRDIKPVRVEDGVGFFGLSFAFMGPPIARTELWYCFFCGEIRAAIQAKRATFLHNVRKFPLNPEISLEERGEYVKGYKDAYDKTSVLLTLARGWKFLTHPTGDHDVPKIWMLACPGCYAEQKKEK